MEVIKLYRINPTITGPLHTLDMHQRLGAVGIPTFFYVESPTDTKPNVASLLNKLKRVGILNKDNTPSGPLAPFLQLLYKWFKGSWATEEVIKGTLRFYSYADIDSHISELAKLGLIQARSRNVQEHGKEYYRWTPFAFEFFGSLPGELGIDMLGAVVTQVRDEDFSKLPIKLQKSLKRLALFGLYVHRGGNWYPPDLTIDFAAYLIGADIPNVFTASPEELEGIIEDYLSYREGESTRPFIQYSEHVIVGRDVSPRLKEFCEEGGFALGDPDTEADAMLRKLVSAGLLTKIRV